MAHGSSRHPDSEARNSRSAAEIQDWLVEQLANELQISSDRINIVQPILSYGIDSMQVVVIVARLEDWLGFRFSSNPLEDHPTIESLALFVAELNDEPQSAVE